ncbi:RNA methyltransferase [Prolixibacteraceae bacterium Z1-6]|uniref:tRNA (guanosine(18)-2'-O)-methyltransferase n=1 Tax=Draconibacterium aestuarii TaxID=2998507 RepID=A0A9X3J6E4_9BACT|nr:RNA methyltransferase [Prolixibacteraceae bacterium Z1-6]
MRTRHITIVLEDIYQSQNASAVLRTCDCFGIQDVHIIENRNEFQDNSEVSMGSSKWLNLKKYNEANNNSLEAIKQLKQQGYRIVATTPHKNDQKLHDFDIAKGKTALVFGSELPGLTETILNEADEFLKIPMYGFTESFNISVSAAIILHHLTLKMRQTEGLQWQLSQEEKDALKMEWIRKTIKRSELLEKRFWEKNRNS